MAEKECSRCIHNAVCKTAESCDGYVSGCEHFKEQKQVRTDVREKLVELFAVTSLEFEDAVTLADHLIAHGVTVQSDKDINVPIKWISVKEQEEPTENGTYLCHGYWFGSRRKQTETAEFFGEWNIANNFILTHWMPLPKPPKGE